MFVNSNQYISVSNQKLQVCVSYNLNWLLTIFREELDAPGEAFYGLSTASSHWYILRRKETPQKRHKFFHFLFLQI